MFLNTDTLSREFTKSLLRPGGSFPSLTCQWTQCLPKRHTIQSCPFHIDRRIKNGTQGDGAQHSITLLTNTSELDSKDTINQKLRPERLIRSLMDIRHTAVTSGRSCDCREIRRSHQRGKAAAHVVSAHRQKARQLGVHST